MKKISDFFSENLHFLVVKFSVHLNRRVFVMTSDETNGYLEISSPFNDSISIEPAYAAYIILYFFSKPSHNNQSCSFIKIVAI